MIRYLLLLQFPFLYVPTIVLGLVVYGSDFNEVGGKLYLLPLFILPVLHRYIRIWSPLLQVAGVRVVILIAGIVCALLAYQYLHFNFWDEHSVSQAVYLSLLGLFSYFASVIAVAQHQAAAPTSIIAVSIAMLVFGLAWMLCAAYPMINLFVIVCVFTVAILSTIGRGRHHGQQLHAIVISKTNTPMIVKYLIFILFMDLAIVAWDYQVNTGWAFSFAITFVSAALVCSVLSTVKRGYLSGLITSRRLLAVPIAVLMTTLNFIAALAWPVFVLSLFHGLLIGVSLGLLMQYVFRQESNGAAFELTLIVMSLPIMIGMVMGYLFYANLAYAGYRFVLLVPLLLLLLLWRNKTRVENSA